MIAQKIVDQIVAVDVKDAKDAVVVVEHVQVDALVNAVAAAVDALILVLEDVLLTIVLMAVLLIAIQHAMAKR